MGDDEPIWPKPGASIFNVYDNGTRSASLAWAQGKHYGYEEGYLRAANLLYEHIEETGTWIDTLIFPLMFLWWQALELQLKRIIVEGSRLREVETGKLNHHNLSKLWLRAKEEIVALGDGEPEGTPIVEKVLGELQSLDPETSGFRFPQTTAGRPSLTNLPQRLDIPNFQEVMIDLHMYLQCGVLEITRRLEERDEMDE